MAPFIADLSNGHAAVRWIDGSRTTAGLADSVGHLVKEHIRELPRGRGWVHTVSVPLRYPGVTQYSVRCGPWADHVVRLPPAPTSGTPLTFVAFGDNRSGFGRHAAIVKAVNSLGPDLVINTGDMVRIGGPATWTQFFEIERPLLANTALFAAFGNHEALGEPDLYDAIFACPRRGPKGTRTCVRDYGDLRLIFIDSEGPKAPQGDWLRRVLAEPAPAGTQRVEVIVLHRPVFTFSLHPPDLDWRAILHPLARDAGVELVFQGHNHLYERFEVEGVTYVTTGGGGAPLYPANYLVRQGETEFLRKAVPVLHYVVGHVSGGRIEIEAREGRLGSVVDKFEVN